MIRLMINMIAAALSIIPILWFAGLFGDGDDWG